MSPVKAQTLHTYTVNGQEICDQIILINTDYTNSQKPVDTEIKTLEAIDADHPLSIKSNKVIQSTSVTTDVTSKKVAEDGAVEDIIADLQLKLFADTNITTAEDGETGSFINLNNFGDGTFTAVNFEEVARQKESESAVEFTLNALIPVNNFGLIMIHYQNLNKDSTTCASIKANDSATIQKFNSKEAASNKITLVEGINIIQLPNSCTLTISSEGNNKASVIFGSLDIVFNENTTAKTTSLNPKLCYKCTDPAGTGNATTPYEQILKDIKAIDSKNEFYYNMPIAGNIDIDMNPNDNKDTLENPLN
jgi:hypothetical protein